MKPDEKESRRVECQRDGEVVNLSKGEVISVEFFRHESVGENTEFTISNESVLKHLRTETEYIHPERMKYPGWTGGDAEKGLWFFEAVETGKTTLSINKILRGIIESKCDIKFVVE